MQTFPLANANASVISVTGTATALLSLIDTAGSTTHAFRPALNAVDIVIEGGDIRVLFDNNTPTTTKGLLLKQGSTLCLRHVPLSAVKLIAVTGTVSCSVQIGTSETEESTTISGASLATGVTTPSTTVTGFGNVLPMAVYNAAPTTRTEGQAGTLQADTKGNLNTNNGTYTKGEDENRNLIHVSNGGDGTRITTAATTVCRNSIGRLNGAYVEVALTGTATFYDNASSAAGTILGILPIGTPQGWHEFKGEAAANGVVCVTSAADRLVVNTGR